MVEVVDSSPIYQETFSFVVLRVTEPFQTVVIVPHLDWAHQTLGLKKKKDEEKTDKKKNRKTGWRESNIIWVRTLAETLIRNWYLW